MKFKNRDIYQIKVISLFRVKQVVSVFLSLARNLKLKNTEVKIILFMDGDIYSENIPKIFRKCSENIPNPLPVVASTETYIN